jgi:predicted MFS family arabinose efflux permease
MATIALTSWRHVLSVPLLGVMSVCVGFVTNMFGVGHVAFVSELVSKTRVTEANARLQASNATCYVVGPALAGLTAQYAGPEAAIGIDSLSFVVAFLFLLAIRAAPMPVQPVEDRRMVAGLLFILRTPVLRALTLILAVETTVTAATLDLFTFRLKSTLGVSDSRVGVMFAVASVGAIVGSLFAIRAKRALGMHWTYVLTAGALAVAFAVAPFVETFVLTAAAAVVFTFNSALRGILSMSRRQEVTPDGMLGRVTATFWLLLAVTRFLGAAIIGRIANAHGTKAAFTIAAISLFALALVTIPARSLREDRAGT